MSAPQKKDTQVLVIAVIIGLLVGVGAYYLLVRPLLHPQAVGVFTTSVSSSSTAATASSSVATATSSAVAAVDTSTWQTYTNYELGFSIQYPSDLVVDSSDPAVFSATFPKTNYFSTAYADSVSVSVTENTQCPSIPEGDVVHPTQRVNIGGVNFLKDETSGIGAGNIDDITSYDAIQNGVCYQILFSDRHANGAGLYVSDPSQINMMNTARANEFAHVTNIVNAMVTSFNFITTPAGQDESSYSPVPPASSSSQATSSPAALAPLFISTISPSTVSVGGRLSIIGHGFLGHDTLVEISNGSVTGILWGGMPTSDSVINLTVPSQVCTVYQGGSGKSCPAYLFISPGVYTVDVSNQNGTTDTTYLKVQ